MKIELQKVKPSNHTKIKGNFDVFLPELGLKIVECRLVLNGKGEYFIGLPSLKVDGNYVSYVFLEDGPFKEELLDEAVKHIARAGQPY